MTFNDGVLELIRTSTGISPHRLMKDIVWSWDGKITEEQVTKAINELVNEHRAVYDGRFLKVVVGDKS